MNIPTPTTEITATTAGKSGIAIHLGSSAISTTTCCVRNALQSTDERDQEERRSTNNHLEAPKEYHIQDAAQVEARRCSPPRWPWFCSHGPCHAVQGQTGRGGEDPRAIDPGDVIFKHHLAGRAAGDRDVDWRTSSPRRRRRLPLQRHPPSSRRAGCHG